MTVTNPNQLRRTPCRITPIRTQRVAHTFHIKASKIKWISQTREVNSSVLMKIYSGFKMNALLISRHT